jgi:hypothetical protein
VEKARLTITQPETTLEEMLNAIGESPSDLAGSDDAENVEAEDDDGKDTELG